MTDTTQHTPGPWYNVNNAYVYARYPNKNGELIASVWCNNAGEEVGNAQLIAQAPTLKAENEALKALNAELIDTLELSLAIIQGYDPYGHHNKAERKLISNVIAKTKGVQS